MSKPNKSAAKQSAMPSFVINGMIVLASLFVMLAGLEVLFRALRMFYIQDVSQKQQGFIQEFSYPYSYGIVRPDVSLDLRAFFPTGKTIEHPVLVSTNSHGMRMREVDFEKPENHIRIALMGDSSTFGWMVPENECFARMMETRISEQCGKPVEVLNFGVPGYTSFHGLMQYRRLVEKFSPDWLILAYGFNDSYESRFPEKEFYGLLQEANLTVGLRGVSLWWFDNSLVGNWIIKRLYGPASKLIERIALKRAEEKRWFARVDQKSYRANLIEIIEAAKENNTKAFLLHLNLPNSWVGEALDEIAQSESIPLFDARDAFFLHEFQQLEYEMWKTEPGSRDADAILARFQTRVPNGVAVSERIYIVGNHERLGNGEPNRIAMHDDGTHGDEKAADRIWTLEATLPRSASIDYSFTNSGTPGKWVEQEPVFENTFKAIRYCHHVDLSRLDGAKAISPLHVFNEIPIQPLLLSGDPIHPNIDGHGLIAEKLAGRFCEDLLRD